MRVRKKVWDLRCSRRVVVHQPDWVEKCNRRDSVAYLLISQGLQLHKWPPIEARCFAVVLIPPIGSHGCQLAFCIKFALPDFSFLNPCMGMDTVSGVFKIPSNKDHFILMLLYFWTYEERFKKSWDYKIFCPCGCLSNHPKPTIEPYGLTNQPCRCLIITRKPLNS